MHIAGLRKVYNQPFVYNRIYKLISMNIDGLIHRSLDVRAITANASLTTRFSMLNKLRDSHRFVAWTDESPWLAEINEADINAKRFEYNELRVATRNFAPEMKLGEGAYGAVYKVQLISSHSHHRILPFQLCNFNIQHCYWCCIELLWAQKYSVLYGTL